MSFRIDSPRTGGNRARPYCDLGFEELRRQSRLAMVLETREG